MGNCLKTTPVTNNQSPSATKPSSPESPIRRYKHEEAIAVMKGGHGGYNNNKGEDKKLEKKAETVLVSSRSSESINKETTIGRDLKKFNLADLRIATRNFRPDSKIGEGGFGDVFKGWIDEKTFAPSTKVGVGIAVAVKKSNPDSDQGLSEWQSEVNFLGKFSHPNLVKLVGYCWEDNNFLLVYEYMKKGSLEKHLFRVGGEILSWETRLKIAIGAAQGLAFLHTSEKSVIYRDFKTSNILLDGEYNAKLSDFGLAKLGPQGSATHVTTKVMGTYGYAAPEYVATGHLYVKSDVFGFGVVLLELLTGLKALDNKRPTGQHCLVDWAKPFLLDKRKLKKIIDPSLQSNYPLKATTKIAALIHTCLDQDPKKRPSMEQVLETLLKARDIKEPLPDQSNGCRLRGHEQQASLHKFHSDHHRSPLNSKYGHGVQILPSRTRSS